MSKTITNLNRKMNIKDDNGVVVERSAYEIEESTTPKVFKHETSKWLLQKRVSDIMIRRDILNGEIIELNSLIDVMDE